MRVSVRVNVTDNDARLLPPIAARSCHFDEFPFSDLSRSLVLNNHALAHTSIRAPAFFPSWKFGASIGAVVSPQGPAGGSDI